MNFNRFQKITLSFFAISCLIFPALTFSQTTLPSVPENPQEVKELGAKALDVAEKQGPGIVSRIWNNEVLPVWKKMFGWTKEHIWEDRLKSKLETVWAGTLRVLKVEVEKRKPKVQEEFQEEKREIKQEAPQVGKSLWEKFKEIIK